MQISTVTEAELKQYIASLPVDDEPLSEDDLRAIAEGEAAAKRGDFATPQEVAAIVDAAN